METKVYFIGAGPGDPDLLTIKAAQILQKADVIIFAGSLVPEELVRKFAKKECKIINSAPLNLDEIHSIIRDSIKKGLLVARVHTGDPSIYGAIHEQVYLLEKDNIDYEIIPGISAAFATAAKARVCFTIPEMAQTLIITRLEGKTKVPERESFENLAATLCPMAIYLSASKVDELQKKCLNAGYEKNTTVVIGYRIGWEDENIIITDLENLVDNVKKYNITRQAVFLILPYKDQIYFSKLYDPEFSHGYRK